MNQRLQECIDQGGKLELVVFRDGGCVLKLIPPTGEVQHIAPLEEKVHDQVA